MPDDEEPQPQRPRRTARQREAGAASRRETRRLLLVAAGELFAERGYTASTVNAIAERAGVSLQTLYLAWGSKRDLLRAFVESALSGSDEGLNQEKYVPGLRSAIDDHAGGNADPRAQLRGFARQFRLIAAAGDDRPAAGLAWRLYRDAAASDPQIAADWQALQLLRRGTFSALLASIPEEALRPGLTRQAAADTAWVIASPESFELLVRHADYTRDAYEQWVGDTLIGALLKEQ